MKKTRGFSYIEVIIALAIFAIAMLAIIPVLTQAGRNMLFAQETYAGHLQAQRLMLVVRDALADNVSQSDVRTRAISFAADDFEFSVWIFGQNAQAFHTIDEPDINAAISGLNATMSNYTSTIIVAVWGDDKQVMGRAIGILYQ